MEHGTPRGAIRTGGLPEMLDGSGALVRPADPAALADAFKALFRSPGLRNELGLAGHRRIGQDLVFRVIPPAPEPRFAGAGTGDR